MSSLLRIMLAAVLLLCAGPAFARETTLQQRVQERLAQAGTGTRFGMVVAADDGRELVAIAPDDRFIPASNTKMFTTAAAFFSLAGLDQPDASGGASVRLDRNGRGVDVILTGNGDARLSSAADCVTDCLAALADAVAARTRRVKDVVGDDTLFPDQRWSPGMSWNNIPTGDGTAVSALTLDDNSITLSVTPGAAGAPPSLGPIGYYTVENAAVTVAAGKTDLDLVRLPGDRTVRLVGTIVAGESATAVKLGIDDPAWYSAWRLKALLETRGVKVRGEVRARHRPFAITDDPAKRGDAPPARPAPSDVLARLTAPPIAADIATILKVSQNLHAELLLRRVGLVRETGSIEDGQKVVKDMLAAAGVPRSGFDFSDGSGMSTYNRVAPRAAVKFLRWIAAQPWGAAWRASLPVAGIDGTLRNRFKGTPLQGRLFAKTGTLNATHALSGYLIARSGRTLTFSVFANDEPADSSAREAMDAALEMVANDN